MALTEEERTITTVVVVVLVLALIWYFAVYRPKHSKDTYHGGGGYGWNVTDWAPGPGVHPTGCSGSAAQACDKMCQQIPGGMSHSNCMLHCMQDDGHPGTSPCSSC